MSAAKVDKHSQSGLKRTVLEGTVEEALELNKLYDDLRKQLSMPRIDRLGGRALATWDPDEKAVHVLRKDGKFGNFGYSHGGRLYLEYYEALFLLEMNRLQLEYHTMIMSVEQAYLLLLGEESTAKCNEYLVYAHLTRIGYILVRHQNIPYYDNIEPTEEDCAWALALNVINNRAIPENVKKSPHFVKVKKQMKCIKECITKQQTSEPKQLSETVSTSINFDGKVISTGKRKTTTVEAENPNETKRRCLEVASSQKSFLDCLKDEPEYRQFQETFAKFDIIQMADAATNTEEEVRTLHIAFDLYLHNDGFKKRTPKPPTFRLLILGVHEPFPTHAEITNTYNLQKYPVPLLVVSVGESKQIQAFMYYFS
uniref:tRNA-splicing endonuclease subunit Sen54 n=1 Tax=Zeugodacus cucurbitae TaxID=28588 RepID=A0A0A1XLN1_ZEUCU